MKLKSLLLLALLSTPFQILTPVTASPMGNLTAAELYATCQSDDKVVYAVCVTALFTIVDTENTIASLLNSIPQICMPEHYIAPDYVSAFTIFLDEYPEYKDNTATWVIIGSFRQIFSCKGNSEENHGKPSYNDTGTIS